MKWVTLRKEKLKNRTRNNRQRRKFINKLRQIEDRYVQSNKDELDNREVKHVARV